MERILKVSNDCGDKIGRLGGQVQAAEARLDVNNGWNERNLQSFDLADRKLKDATEKINKEADATKETLSKLDAKLVDQMKEINRNFDIKEILQQADARLDS
jgi:hypothetical protein